MAVYSVSGWLKLAVYAASLTLLGFAIWLGLQVYRSRLLGGAVRVSETTLPELQAVFDEVRARLDYRKHVDVYVKDKVDGGSLMTSYLGTRLIEIEGGLVAELLDEGHHAELTYLIGRHIGQLKARHQRLTLIFLAISAVDSVKFLQPFLAPYLRATAKSGDQIGAACCGDIRATAATMNRLLAGKELGPRLVIKGVLDQAAVVRRRWLPRLAQLLMSVPHATNRYLNLLAFFARVAPEEDQRVAGDPGPGHGAPAQRGARRVPEPAAAARHPSLLSALLAVVVTGGVLAASGWLIFGYLAGARAADTASQELLTHMQADSQPPACRSPCPRTTPRRAWTPRSDASRTRSAAGDRWCTCTTGRTRRCRPNTTAWPRGCRRVIAQTGPARDTYTLASSAQTAGRFVCGDNESGQHVFAWTYDDLDILSVAASGNASLPGLYRWWSQGDPGPDWTLEPGAPPRGPG